jgi:hypothetical protein
MMYESGFGTNGECSELLERASEESLHEEAVRRRETSASSRTSLARGKPMMADLDRGETAGKAGGLAMASDGAGHSSDSLRRATAMPLGARRARSPSQLSRASQDVLQRLRKL